MKQVNEDQIRMYQLLCGAHGAIVCAMAELERSIPEGENPVGQALMGADLLIEEARELVDING